MKTTGVFSKLVKALAEDPRYIDNCGGTRSGKTYAMLQLLILIVMRDTFRSVNSVVSETLPHLKKGAIRQFKEIMQNEGWWDARAWNESDHIYTFPNGAIIEFFSVESPEKVHGPERDRIFVNEAQNIKEETAKQLFIRTRLLVMWDYNPTHSFWTNEVYAVKPNCITVRSTYLDNGFLTKAQVQEIEDNRVNKNWWRVYGLGEIGVLEGVVYEFATIDEIPADLPSSVIECYGLDYGFTNSITALVHVFIDEGRKAVYADEEIYRRGLHNSDIAELMAARGVPTKSQRAVPVYADSAEPKSNSELSQYGYNVKGCDKTTTGDRHNPITTQIGHVQGYKLHFTKRSVNMIKEARGYMWDTGKNGERLNVPVPVEDHTMDALRYAIYTATASRKGQYSVSVR